VSAAIPQANAKLRTVHWPDSPAQPGVKKGDIFGPMDKFWHWAEILFKVLGAVVIIFELPRIIRISTSFFRKAYDQWSLSSHRRAVKRLAQLEADLKKLDEPPPMEERQAEFYNWVLVILSAIAAGLMSGSWYFYALRNVGREPNPFLALAVVCFLIAAIAGLWGMHHFQSLLQSVRKARRLEIERGIKAMKEKLANAG
jgi:hypothetical protein